MPAFQDVSRTVAFPVHSEGDVVVDATKAIIARTPSPYVAAAIADAMNLGHPAILEREAAHKHGKRRMARSVMSQREHDRMERSLALANQAHRLMG